MENQKEHKRRIRYKGTHPKKFNEKYKELQPDKYYDDIKKIIEKGKTPAGMHISICVDEILDVLQIKPGQIGLDMTLGYGGHTQKMLEALNHTGHLYALDIDSIELEKTKKRLENLGFDSKFVTIINKNFCEIDTILQSNDKFDFILADLGLSSMQIDNPERGFTYKYDGPLDLRLNPTKGITGSLVLEKLTCEELENILIENSDEPYARPIAQYINMQKNKGLKIETTKQLAELIAETFVFNKIKENKDNIKKTIQRVFQAIRIEVNRELDVLYEMLEKLPNVLAKNGKVAILTFHSGEDRLVKKSFKFYKNEGIYSEVARDVIRPSKEECFNNSRAKSAKLRWAIKS